MSKDLPPTESVHSEALPSESIGKYRLLQRIGEGGMGEVYLAEQDDPRRKVALKIIKAGMDTKQVIARFEAERQALALMDHPNIAKVFDAGATEHGRPYFVMEYIKGVPVTEHCDRHRLTTKARLRLFVRVCEGVQHAHQKGVIHRDIKPSNVLVTLQGGSAVPKIIDFGVAKATAQRLTEKTMFTAIGVVIGTPEYMSPEQAELTGQDIDTRTDVYSLGVILYELLVGALPFDSQQLRQAAFDEFRRQIREDEPSKPSTRISTLDGQSAVEAARLRRCDLSTLRRELRGELDWITMRAMEKDRTRRYQSPAELAADVRHHLRHEPVKAIPPSTFYVIKKFVRRHRVALAVVSALILGISGTAWGIARQVDQSNALRIARIDQLWRELNWHSCNGRDREVTQLASEILGLDANNVRALRARAVSGAILARSGAPDTEMTEKRALRDVARIMELEPGSSWPHRIHAWMLRKFGKPEEAAEAERLALAKRSTVLSADEMHMDAMLAVDEGKYDTAIELLSQVIARHPNWQNSIAWRALALRKRGDLMEAAIDYRVAAALDPNDFYSYYDLARIYIRLDKLDDAELHLQRALDLKFDNAQVHELSAHYHLERGKRAFSDGQLQAANEHFRLAEQEARAAIAIDSDLLWARNSLGASLVEQTRDLEKPDMSKLEQAIEQFEHVRQTAHEHLEPSDLTINETSLAHSALINLCDAYTAAGDLEAALRRCSAATEALPNDAVVFYNLAGVYALLGRHDEAFEALEQDFALGDRDYGWLQRDRWFETMRNDPRFFSLVQRMRDESDP